MKIPKKVKVGGLIYKVKEVKRLCNNKRTEGYQYQSGQMIKLKKSLPKEYKEKTFIHELIHAMFDFLMWEHDETTVESLAQVLYMVIKDNPELFS